MGEHELFLWKASTSEDKGEGEKKGKERKEEVTDKWSEVEREREKRKVVGRRDKHEKRRWGRGGGWGNHAG